MKLLITGRRMRVSQHLEEYMITKSRKLGRHLPMLTELRAEVAVDESRAEGERYRCQLTTTLAHRVLHATELAPDVHGAINGAVAKLDRQLSKIKLQHQHKGRPALNQVQELLAEA